MPSTMPTSSILSLAIGLAVHGLLYRLIVSISDALPNACTPQILPAVKCVQPDLQATTLHNRKI